ncbi:hypothetical protein J655_3935 [Acinetobacter sp. 1294243]|nr:hypothetical protein ACINWC692_2143 [Acinetobacter baumannii WC-692]EXB17265.1 hypothetical protein J535_3635 [Acinetobacter baumannii 1429530]EXC10244.1 hypothetical protein J533_3571 [Acinetobacter baumannii 4749]EXH09604.1 hypothetical protein J627_3699 [Acinetobacter sp. 1245593]EXR25491.1 hypothetical protein J689_3602 [Acinetobacter sp. 1179249]EXR36452.1 hypothetical protein J655_3935 [Acinetobacter sp. 1294243]
MIDKDYQGLKRLNIPDLMPFKASQKRPLGRVLIWLCTKLTCKQCKS